MWNLDEDALARRMFAAYNEQAGGLTWDGKPIPPWESTGPKVQANWRAAARAAIQGAQESLAEMRAAMDRTAAAARRLADRGEPIDMGDEIVSVEALRARAEAYEASRALAYLCTGQKPA